MNLADKTLKWLRWSIEGSLVLAMILLFIQESWDLMFLTMLTFGIIKITRLAIKNSAISMTVELEIIIILLIYAGFFVGDVNRFYAKIGGWDTSLHFLYGIVIAMVSFLYFYMLYLSGKIKSNPLLISFLTFTIVAAMGVIWEVVEFLADTIIFNGKMVMQGGGLKDTMIDLLASSIGSIFICAWGYYYLRGDINNEGSRLDLFIIKRFEEQNKKNLERMKLS